MYSKIVIQFISVLLISIQFSSVNVDAKFKFDQINKLNNRLFNELGNILLQRVGETLAYGNYRLPELDPLIIEDEILYITEAEVPGFNGYFKFRNVEITGLTDVVLKDFELLENEVDDSAVISGKLTFPGIHIVVYYTFEADYYPLFDNFCRLGRFSAHIADFVIDAETVASVYDDEVPLYQHKYDVSTSVGDFTINPGYTRAC